MTDQRILGLQSRKENNRDKNQIMVRSFDLSEIDAHFDENLTSLKQHFMLADDLVASGKVEEAKDIWRTQIVFLDSALDYYIHEITKYGMSKIFNNEWAETDKYKNYNLKLFEVLYVIKNPEDTTWFIEHVNESYQSDTFMDYQTIKDQLNLLGIIPQKVADKAFFVQGSCEKTIDQLKSNLNRIFKRRNDIAHQSDRNHLNGIRNDISKDEVEREIICIEKIVKAISANICDDSCRISNSTIEGACTDLTDS